ncbi:hypothetical protein PsYK624_025880 [Phanerochaete sordida]|uniref:RNI-like protein n=1 Tax=Phanerochaete sordida TaxID=48140 RepID=A0A9P3G058_9APHY|nr:hypothetical protein PsYK624_025880 [Phanerochaete sordida]
MDTDVVEVNRALRHVDQLNHLLQVYTRRIAYLSIAAQNVRILRLTLPSLCRKPFPLIEYIDLEAAPDALHASRNYSLAQSPNLRTLWLAAIPFSFSNVIYENLTSLTIGEITIVPGDLRDAAKACPNLTVLHLDAVGIKLDGGEFIRFPRLESLRLANIAGPDGYLDWLDAPALSLIAISFCTLASHGVSTFDPSILRPFPTVRLLRCESLDAIPAPPFDGNVFQYVPGATTLALRDCCMGEGSLAAHLAAAVPAPLPALQTLVVGELESGGLEAVLRIVRHRIQHEVPLKEVQLGKDIREAMDAELLRTLEELVMVTTAPDVDDLDDS